jgi:hypothetical protein
MPIEYRFERVVIAARYLGDQPFIIHHYYTVADAGRLVHSL